MTLFELLGKIFIDNADAKKALQDTSNEGTKTQGKLSKVFSAVGKGAVAVGKTVGVGLAAGATAMGTLTVKALNLSGELEQNMGGSEQVFKQYADSMQSKAKEAFSNMGLSTSDYLGTANKMGALFQGAGFSIEESMNLSSESMQRAADVASIMGIDTGAAMEAIAGAAKGNFTMMDNLGVAMNDTTLNAYALSKGIDKTTQDMTNQEKIGLAMEMFMEKTAYAAGNYARENETLAGSLGTAKAALTNFLDGSGDVDSLVTAFTNAANVIVDNVKTIAPRLVTGLVDLVNGLVPQVPGILQALLPPIVEGAVSLVEGLVAALPAALEAIMGILPSLLEGVISIFNALVAALPQLIELICAALPSLIPQLITGLVTLFVTLCNSLPDIIQPIIDYLPEIIVALVDGLMANLPDLVMGLIQLIGALCLQLPQILAAVGEALWGALKSILENVASWFGADWGTIWQGVCDFFSNIWDSISGIFSTVWNAIKTAVSTAVTAVKNVITTVFTAIKSFFTTVWNGIKSVFTTVWNAIKTAVTTVINAIKTVIENVVNGIKTFIQTAFSFIKDKIITPITNAKDKVVEIFNNIKSNITDKINAIKSKVTDVFNSIKEKMSKPIEKARDTIKGIVDKVKGFFNFKIEFPKIKMPHFGITPKGWQIGDLLKGSIPKLGIDWYAKAMNNPMILTEPSIFGYNAATGELLGGGEAGSEVVTGTGTLMGMIQSAVDSRTEAQTNKIVSILTAILSAILDGNADVLKALLAGQSIVLNEREVARTVRRYA